MKAVTPADEGWVIFIGPEDKTFIIHVDQFLGTAIYKALNDEKSPRPFTHELIGSILLGLGASLERVVINDVKSGTFFARIILKMENELGTKLIELDARPSDSIVLALNAKKPIFVAKSVLDSEKDVTALLEKLLKDKD